MSKTIIFCLTLNPDHENLIKKLSYVPVGLGNKKFTSDCFSDKTGINISNKNPYYGEYTFHYWIWKNYINKINEEWVGFCQYRKFFSKNINPKDVKDFETLNSTTIKEIENNNERFDCILGNKFSVENYKLSKILKNHLLSFLLRPKLFFSKKKGT